MWIARGRGVNVELIYKFAPKTIHFYKHWIDLNPKILTFVSQKQAPFPPMIPHVVFELWEYGPRSAIAMKNVGVDTIVLRLYTKAYEI